MKISAERIKIPVIFHNLKGYDSHFIIQKIGELANEGKPISIEVIPNNTEKNIWLFILVNISILLIAFNS